MGLHTALAVYGIYYGSEEALEFTDAYFRALRYYALKASNKIAIEKGKTFEGFEKSEYADGSYIKKKYIDEDFNGYKSEKVNDIFRHIGLPTKNDWERLNMSIMNYGLYNSYLLAVAPNGSISYVNEASSSIHPITQRVEHRQEKKTGAIFYPAPYLSNETMDFYESAYDIDQRKIIDTYATAQKHVDQGMSLTLFMQSELPEGLYEWKKGKSSKMTTRDLNKLRNYAWTKGIKSIYYIRTFTKDGTVKGANTCESCSI